MLRNRIEDFPILKKAGLIKEEPDNPLNKIEVDGDDQWLLFPAKLYCGQSLLDSRRESIIIDRLHRRDFRLPRDARQDGRSRRFRGADEIRMIRLAFYLGRAYIDRAFVVNFVLYNEEHDKGRQGSLHEDRCSAGGLLERHPAAAHHRRQGGLSDGRPADMETGHDNVAHAG